MLPAYFPFTYASEIVAKKINSVLGKFTIYQPVKNLFPSFVENELFSILIPSTDYEHKTKQTINEFWNLVSTNRGSKKIDVKLTQTIFKGKPFYNDSSIEFIRNEIMNIKPPKSKSLSDNNLFTSCLFMALAQYNDFYNDQFSLNIENFKTKEKILTDILQNNDVHEDNSTTIPKISNKYNFGQFMCFERIKAWSSIVLDNGVIPDFLVTSSFSILECLMELNFEVKMLKSDFIKIKCKKIGENNIRLPKTIIDIITQSNLSKHEVVSVSDTYRNNRKNQVMIFLLPGVPIHKFLIKISPTKLHISASKTNRKINNTVIILIE